MNLTLVRDGYAGLERTLPINPLYEDVIEPRISPDRQADRRTTLASP
jgi:hypothetical protein